MHHTHRTILIRMGWKKQDSTELESRGGSSETCGPLNHCSHELVGGGVVGTGYPRTQWVLPKCPLPSGYWPSAHLIIWAAGSQMSHGIAFTTHQWQVSQLFGADYLVISWVADYRYNPIPRRELSLQILTKGNPIQSQEVSYL